MSTNSFGDEFFNALLQSYSTYFDIDSDITIDGITYAATAAYHARSEKYVLVKKAKLWAAETNEYVYFFITDKLDTALLQVLTDNVIQTTLKKIHPHNEHMCTHMSLIVLTKHIHPSTYDAIQRTKFRKSFLFSLHGWTALRLAVVDLTNQSIITNKEGAEIKRRLHKLLHKYHIH